MIIQDTYLDNWNRNCSNHEVTFRSDKMSLLLYNNVTTKNGGTNVEFGKRKRNA